MTDCAHCAELDQQIDQARRELAELGRQGETFGITPDHECERALARWLTGHPNQTPAEAYRAGWAALARYVSPLLREWQQMWRQKSRDQDALRARMGTLLREISRLGERG